MDDIFHAPNFGTSIVITNIHYIIEDKFGPSWQRKEIKGRDFNGLVFIIDGKLNVHFLSKLDLLYSNESIKNSNFNCQKNDILFFPQGSKFELSSTEDTGINYIVVNFEVEDQKSLLSLNLQPVNKLESHNGLHTLFAELLQYWHFIRYGFKVICSSLLLQIIYRLMIDANPSPIDSLNGKRLQKAVDYMEKNYTKNDVSIEVLCNLVNLSPNHFRRLFNEVYGVAPIKYLNSIRIHHAIDLLNSRLYSITQIAEMTGYSNVYYFSRFFKKVTGQNPMKWIQR